MATAEASIEYSSFRNVYFTDDADGNSSPELKGLKSLAIAKVCGNYWLCREPISCNDMHLSFVYTCAGAALMVRQVWQKPDHFFKLF